MGRRGRLEQERTRLLQRAGRLLGVPAQQVTLERLCDARSRPPAPRAVRERSAELRGLLAEIAREHGINRALMRQELAFLSHLCGSSATSRGRLPADRRAAEAAASPPRCTAPSTSRPSDVDLLLLRPPDLAARPARPAARARRHRPQHRQRNTAGYSRQEACSPPRRRSSSAGGAVQGGAGAHIGSGVDVQRLPPHPRQVPRPPVPRAGHEPRRARRHAPRRSAGRSCLRRARRQRHRRAAVGVLERVGRPRATPPTTTAARAALLEQRRRPDRHLRHGRRAARARRPAGRGRVRRADRRPAARSSRSAARSPRSTRRSRPSSPPATRRTT